jgi:hypothetical protein
MDVWLWKTDYEANCRTCDSIIDVRNKGRITIILIVSIKDVQYIHITFPNLSHLT